MPRASGSPSSCNPSAAREYRAGPHLRRLKIRPRERLAACALRLGLTRPDAEDLVQDVYVILLEHLHSGRLIPDFFAYLVGCLDGRVANSWVRNSRRARLLERQPPPRDVDPSPEDCLLAAVIIYRILIRLSPGDAEVLQRRYLADMSTREVAERLGIPEAVVRTRLHRALVKARAVITVKDTLVSANLSDPIAYPPRGVRSQVPHCFSFQKGPTLPLRS